MRDIGEKGQGEETAPSDSRQRESGTEALRAHSVGCIIISLYANFVGLEGQSARWKATRWSALNRSTDGIHVVSILRSRYRHNAGCGAVGAGAKLLQDASCSMASFHASVGSGCAGKLPAVLQPRLSRMGKAPLNRSNVVTNETLCCGAAVESHKCGILRILPCSILLLVSRTSVETVASWLSSWFVGRLHCEAL